MQLLLDQAKVSEDLSVKKWNSVRKNLEASQQQSHTLDTYLKTYASEKGSTLNITFYKNTKIIMGMISEAKIEVDKNIEQLKMEEYSHYLHFINACKKKNTYEKMLKKVEISLKQYEIGCENKQVDELNIQKFVHMKKKLKKVKKS